MEDWAEIRRLRRAEQMPIKAIARRLGVARNTVRAALAAEAPPVYSRPVKGSLVDGVELRVRALLAQFPTMPATVIAQRIGWEHSLTILKDRIRQIRPEYRGTDPADRIVYEAGDTVQCDLWFPEPRIPVGDGQARVLPVLVMTSMYSKFLTARLLPSRHGGDLTAGMWKILGEDLRAVPKRLWWDRESAIARTGRPTQLAASFAGTLATRYVIAPARDPEFKGGVERTNRYFETSFLPGRSFTNPYNFEFQLQEWLAGVANQRKPRALGGSTPAEVLATDRAAMTALPPVAPQVGLSSRVRLPRDYYVRLDTNDYSVDPRVIGRFVDVTSSLVNVSVTCEGKKVADHDRSWGQRRVITEPVDVATAADLRAAYRRQAAHQAAVERAHADGTRVPMRSLTDYDRYYGVVNDTNLPDTDHEPPHLEVVR